MPNKERDIKDILRLLGSWITEIRLENAISYLDINKVSEGFAMKLLNLIYDYGLEDLNKIQANFAGLDLGNYDRTKVAFQVTSRTDTAKVISDLKTIVKENHYLTFSGGIKFLILREGQKINFTKKSDPKKHLPAFDIDADIMYPETLTLAIEEIYDKDDFSRFLQIKTLVERELQFITTGRPEDIKAYVDASEQRIQEKLDEKFASLAGFSNTNQRALVYDYQENAEFPDWRLPGKRRDLTEKYFNQLVNKSIFWLTGVSGTGKSSLAWLIAQKFTGPKYWIDFRDTPLPDLSATLFRSLSNSIYQQTGNLYKTLQTILKAVEPDGIIVLNDLPDVTSNEQCHRLLFEFTAGTIDSGVKLIITSNFQPLLSFSNLYDEQLILTPILLFNEQETEEVLRYFGAPESTLATHVKTVQVLSEGYPVIINSMIAYLKDKNWQTGSETINNIFNNNYNDRLNHEIYGKIISSTEDDDTLELLYRTKLIFGTFGNEELETISQVVPEIKHPQQKFERIKGIWIQSARQNKFQLSPLVRRLDANVAAKTAKAIYLELANALIKKKTLNQVEISKAMHYFISAESYTEAAMLLTAVLRQAVDNPTIFFEWGFNLYWFYSPIPDAVNPETRMFIRFLQVNVCISAKEPYDFLLDDIRYILATEGVDKRAVGLAHLSFYHVLSLTDPMQAMNHLLAASRSVPLKELFSDETEVETNNRLQQAIWLPFCGCKTKADFEGWFKEIDEITIDKSLLNPKTNQAYVAAGLSLYVNLIAPRKVGDNADLQALLFNIFEKSANAGLGLIGAYCLRNLVVLLCEDHEMFEQAEDLVSKYDTFIESDSVFKFLVYDELGRQYFVAGKNNEVDHFLSQVVELQIPSFFTEQVAAFRVYGQVKGEEDPALGLSYTQKALDFVLTHHFFPTVEIIKLYGEVGIANWLAGDLLGAVNKFEQGYDLLHKVFDESPDLQAQVIRYGSVSNYVAQILMTGKAPTETEDGPYAVPKRGSFYFTNDKIHESGMYNRERRYMPAHLFQVTYQYLNDFDIARKWALVCIQIMVEVSEPRFAILLHSSLIYLIVDKEYGKALNVFKYIKKHYKPGAAKFSQNAADAKALKISERINSNDAIFYNYLLTPLLLKVIPDLMDQTILPADYDAQTAELFESPELAVSDNYTLTFIMEIFQLTIRERMNPTDLQGKMNIYQGEYLSEVQMMSYLLVGIHSSAKEAAYFQLSMVNRLDTHYASIFADIFNLLIIPFFEQFWILKARQCKAEFYDFEIWDTESVPRFKIETGKRRMKVLFQTLVYHLDLELPAQLTLWIKSK